MAEVLWYYAKNDRPLGPVSPTELKQLATRGELQPADLIWREGMEDWEPASKVKGLFSGSRVGVGTARLTPGSLPASATPTSTVPVQSTPVSGNTPIPLAHTPPLNLGGEAGNGMAGETFPLSMAGPSFQQNYVSRVPSSMANLLWFSQVMLWTICAIVVLVGAVLLTWTILNTTDANQQIAAGIVFVTFFIGSYVVARAGERMAELLRAYYDRKR